METAPRLSLFDAITAAATRPGGREDAQATLDELRRRRDSVAPNAQKRRRGSFEPSLRSDGLRERVTDAHVKTMTAMVFALSFAPKTVHTQIWCAWWWWPKEIAKLLEDIRFYGWGVSSLQHHEGAGGSGSSGRGYLRKLKWVGNAGEWYEGEDLTPEGLKFFAKFLEMDLDDVPESLKQVPHLPELMSATFVGLWPRRRATRRRSSRASAALPQASPARKRRPPSTSPRRASRRCARRTPRATTWGDRSPCSRRPRHFAL